MFIYAGYLRLSYEYRTIKGLSLMYCLMPGHIDSHCKAISYNERIRYCELNDKSGLYDEVDSAVKHNENTPIQYTVIFHGCKNDYFRMKYCDIFSYFSSRHRLRVQCFRAKRVQYRRQLLQ